jgi:hypothetical protein
MTTMVLQARGMTMGQAHGHSHSHGHGGKCCQHGDSQSRGGMMPVPPPSASAVPIAVPGPGGGFFLSPRLANLPPDQLEALQKELRTRIQLVSSWFVR